MKRNYKKNIKKQNKKVHNYNLKPRAEKSETYDNTKSRKQSKSLKEQEKINEILDILEIQPEEENNSSETEKTKKYSGDKTKSDEDLDKYAEEIIEYLEKEKNSNIKILEEKKIETSKKPKLSKVNTLDIEENIEINYNLIYNENKEKDSPLEIKDKIFKNSEDIKDNILYEGKLFIKERHQPKKFPTIINYRCKNQRKKEER